MGDGERFDFDGLGFPCDKTRNWNICWRTLPYLVLRLRNTVIKPLYLVEASNLATHENGQA